MVFFYKPTLQLWMVIYTRIYVVILTQTSLTTTFGNARLPIKFYNNAGALSASVVVRRKSSIGALSDSI